MLTLAASPQKKKDQGLVSKIIKAIYSFGCWLIYVEVGSLCKQHMKKVKYM